MAGTCLEEIRIDPSSHSVGGKDEGSRPMTNDSPSLQSGGGKDEGSRPMTNNSPSLQSVGGKDEGSRANSPHLGPQQINEILNCGVVNEIRNREFDRGFHLSSWLKHIVHDGGDSGGGNKKPRGPKIPRYNYDVVFKGDVNKKMKENNKSVDENFGPCAVSIGPYHFINRKEKLNKVEILKVPMARQFIRDCIKHNRNEEASETDVKSLYEKVADKAKDAKGFYDTSSTEWFNEDQFNVMMFLDGCFILQFIHCVTGGYEESKEKESAEITSFYEKLKDLSDRQVADVKRDLLLLENQLPFPILDVLLEQRYKEGTKMDRIDKFLPFRDQKQPFSLLFVAFVLCIICCLYCCFFRCISQKSASKDEQTTSGKNKQSGSDDNPKHAHLLGYLYWKFTESKEQDDVYKFIPGSGKTKLSLGTRGHYLYYSAKDLKKVGIHFGKSDSSALTDVRFASKLLYGTLRLPPITIDESTKSMLLNLMAYEAATSQEVAWVRSYICFMDSLIDNGEDVKELRSKGIISNFLGTDLQVAELFNNMTESVLEPDSRAYNDIKKEINMQCNSTFKKWVADSQHKYFSSPWSLIALIAAVFTIFLTAVATYTAVWPIN